MRNHRHESTKDSQQGYGSGYVPPSCGSQRCTVTGAHVSVRCRCGALGVICPRRRNVHWTDAVEAYGETGDVYLDEVPL